MKLWAILFTAAAIPLYFSSPAYAAGGEPLNAGFVSGIWYSKMPFFAGDQIRIYSAIHNQSGFDLIGKVKFFDDSSLIGESDFSVVSGRVIEKWVDWKAIEGKHSLYVRIVDAKKSVVGKPPESVALRFDSSGTDEQFADFDTDGDGVGNRDDSDDDGDEVLDEVEIQHGTDPLKQDTDGDGISDYKDANPLQASGGVDENVTSKRTTSVEVSYGNEDEGISYDNMVLKTVGRVNDFTGSLKKKIEKKEIALQKEIEGTDTLSDENNSEGSSQIDIFNSAIEKILGGEDVVRNIHMATLSAIAFTLENKFVFYSVMFVALFLALMCIVHFLRSKKK